ncbi:MAG: response regulator [Geothrix sp.]|uniref:hybrid sensor histidine kinase/response regulator n=1 Tax=Geothrix sp. TaxID=1962974 RepID=UPI001816D9A3|nr:ATP-binding protein [Geothrix sp.]NWJ39924.1 response regulator [Geothrix sp.]WIL22064.1 MAG: ATP-binding protein [Geothrix sp.]
MSNASERPAPPPDTGDGILIVEDDPHFSDLLAGFLSPKAGFGEIKRAKTLAQALEFLEAGGFALVFLDLHLRDSRGLDTLIAVQAKARDANVLVMTSVADEELGLQAMREGAHDYFMKGRIPPDGMRRMARYAIERRSAGLALKKSQAAMEIQLRHAQKMEAIGQLAAGIAHEINTPIQFIGDNCQFLGQGFTELIAFFEGFAAGRVPAPEDLQRRLEALDLDYLSLEIPKAIQQSLDGVARVSKIVSAMKDFSHPGNAIRQAVDLNKAIESTLTVSNNAWKYCAVLETHFATDLPLVPCFQGEFNQVILNLVVNAAHAIEESRSKRGEATPGRIVIRTQRIGDEVVVEVSDNGAGMPPDIQARIFDPFFTTKEVGKGTGQGLSIARAVMVDQHKGRISVQSRPGEGTTFTLGLPLHPVT